MSSISEEEATKNSLQEQKEGRASEPHPIDSPPAVTQNEETEETKVEVHQEEPVEELNQEKILSIVESILFTTDRPQSVTLISQAFKGTNTTSIQVKEAIETLKTEYANNPRQGFTLEAIHGGFQLRTKLANMTYLKRMIKTKTFKLSGPILEALAIVAYKQPCTKASVDEIRGVESGHLLRGLMDKGLLKFLGKSEFPGKPMLYGTTPKFLEVFGLRNTKELPSLSEIDSLLPEGIGDIDEKKDTLSELTQNLSEKCTETYSQGEEELAQITDQLNTISTSSEFFEQEKQRLKAQKDLERAKNIRRNISLNKEVSSRDKKWLKYYEISNAHEESASEEMNLGLNHSTALSHEKDLY